MQYAIQFQAELLKGQLRDGDIVVSNHPRAGGTHLPDITVSFSCPRWPGRLKLGTDTAGSKVICPVFEDGEIVFFVAAYVFFTLLFLSSLSC